jgi:hypothetical protein
MKWEISNKQNRTRLVLITALVSFSTIFLLTGASMMQVYGQSETSTQNYSDQFKAQQAIEDHPCLYSGDPNMASSVVQLDSDPDKDGASVDECLEYIDILIEQFGYKVFSVVPWGDDEYTWTLN